MSRCLLRTNHVGAGVSTPAGNQSREAILAHLRSRYPYASTIRELCAATGLRSSSTVWFHVQNLVAAGLAESRGKLGVLITPRGRDKFPTPLPALLPLEWIL